MKKIVINKSYDKFSVSHQAFLRLRELGQPDALKEEDPGAYWPEAATPREPSLVLDRTGEALRGCGRSCSTTAPTRPSTRSATSGFCPP